jgi:hypothetical protein
MRSLVVVEHIMRNVAIWFPKDFVTASSGLKMNPHNHAIRMAFQEGAMPGDLQKTIDWKRGNVVNREKLGEDEYFHQRYYEV